MTHPFDRPGPEVDTPNAAQTPSAENWADFADYLESIPHEDFEDCLDCEFVPYNEEEECPF